MFTENSRVLLGKSNERSVMYMAPLRIYLRVTATVGSVPMPLSKATYRLPLAVVLCCATRIAASAAAAAAVV